MQACAACGESLEKREWQVQKLGLPEAQDRGQGTAIGVVPGRGGVAHAGFVAQPEECGEPMEDLEDKQECLLCIVKGDWLLEGDILERDKSRGGASHCWRRSERTNGGGTRVTAAEVKRTRGHLSLEAEPAAPAEARTVAQGGSGITLRSGIGLFVPASRQATSPHISPGAPMLQRTGGSFLPVATYL